MDANLADLAVGRNHGVELLTVLLHNLLQLFSTQVQRLRFVEIWMNQTDELVTLLNHYAFADECQGVELIFDFLRIDVLARCTQEHVLAAAFDEHIAISVHRAEVACMIPAFLVEGSSSSFLVLVIAEHHVRTLCQNLAWYILWVWTVYLHHHVFGSLTT